MRATSYLVAPVCALLAIVQAAVLPHLRFFAIAPQLLLLVALAWGLLRGPLEGAIWAFTAGMFLDLFSAGPMGVTSLALMGAVLAAIFVQRALPHSRFFLPALLAGLATFLYFVLYLGLLRLFGHRVGMAAAGELPPLVLLHTILILPIYWLLSVVEGILYPKRVTI